MRLSIERVLLAFSENESGSLRDESLGCLEGDDEGEEFVEVGVRSKCRLGLGCGSVVRSSVILSHEKQFSFVSPLLPKRDPGVERTREPSRCTTGSSPSPPFGRFRNELKEVWARGKAYLMG